MSHKDAHPLTAEQQCFETELAALHGPGDGVAFGRDKHGRYLSIYTGRAWSLWQRAVATTREKQAVAAVIRVVEQSPEEGERQARIAKFQAECG